MDLYEHYYPMSAFETAIREIYFRHAPILKGGLSAYTSQQSICAKICCPTFRRWPVRERGSINTRNRRL